MDGKVMESAWETTDSENIETNLLNIKAELSFRFAYHPSKELKWRHEFRAIVHMS